jgi:DnaJ domain
MRPRARQDPHAVLGVQPGASRAEIRRAYRRRALETHPDVAGTHATADMAALNHARDELEARGEGPATEAHDPDDGAARWWRPGPLPTEEPAWPDEQQTVWPDYWSAWNDLPRRP